MRIVIGQRSGVDTALRAHVGRRLGLALGRSAGASSESGQLTVSCP